MDQRVDTVPRRVYDDHIRALSDRASSAEECVIALLNLITNDDGAFLASHGYDWKLATEDLLKP